MNNINNKASEKKPEGTHRRLFNLARQSRGFLPVLALLSFLSTSVIIALMYLMSVIINDVFILNRAPDNLFLYLMASAILARAALVWIRERFAQQNAVKIKSKLRLRVIDQILRQSPANMRHRKTGELVNTIADGTEKLDDYYTKYIPSIVHIAVLPVVIIAFAFYTDWLSGLIMFLTAPLILFFMWLIGTWAKNLTNRQWYEMSVMSGHFLDVLQGIKTLKIFNRNRAEASKVDQVSDNFRIITMKVLKIAFLSGMVLELAASISIAMVALQVGIRLIEGMMAYQMGLFILLLTPEFYLPFRSLGQHHHTGMEGASAAEKLFEELDTPALPYPVSQTGSMPHERVSINVDAVDFYYPAAEEPALSKINCSILSGMLTAIVGHTGSGKTTFSYLLLKYLQPTSGQIFINGIPIDQIPEDQFNRMIAYVPQHPHFFDLSVLDNLLMANPQANMQQVEEACRKAGAHDFINGLPQSYHTQLTENAARLSSGERQRLAIARAFLKNAPLLILDEPTSNLDPESEELISQATFELIKNRTTLIIAHRLSTVRSAGKILVFNQGQIVASGTHESLLAENGIYAGFIQNQRNGGDW